MKTILMTMSRGGTARNILQTDVYNALKESGARLIILTPAWTDERFINEFRAENVIFENLAEPKWGFWDNFLVGWHKALVYNNSTKMRDLYGIYDPEEGNYLKYIIKKIIFWPLSRLKFLRNIFRWLDKIFVRDTYYGELFDKYQPDLVFSTSLLEDADTYVLKQARERRIKTVGMVKTWDNMSKMCFRVKTDKLIVWSEYSKDEAIKFQNYKENEIVICGIPQFDFYKKSDYEMTRKEFCGSVGIPEDKKIILFCSEGKVTKYDGEVAEIIADYMAGGQIKNCVLFIRPHFMYKDDEKKFSSLAGKKDIFLDSGYDYSRCFRDRWDYSKEQIKRFTNIMRYADVVVTSASTISLDAAAFNRPIINIVFDGKHQVPFAESVAHWYLTEYSQEVIKSGGVWLTDNKDELLNAINSYLDNQNLLSDGRECLRNYFCHKIDGLSGKRIGEAIIAYANQ